MIQKGYYRGLNIAIEAELRKPKHEQNPTIFKSFCVNKRNLVLEIAQTRQADIEKLRVGSRDVFPDLHKKPGDK